MLPAIIMFAASRRRSKRMLIPSLSTVHCWLLKHSAWPTILEPTPGLTLPK